jgi:hypothetical protein
MPEWLSPFFSFFPAYAFFFLGLGVPWALVLLPRDEWRHPMMVLGLGLPLGPLLGTSFLFALGTWGSFRSDFIVTGLLMLCLLGLTGAWLRRHTSYSADYLRPEAWTRLEKYLLVLLGLAFVGHLWATMYWPFIQYDTLWTFGYNPRLFLYHEVIPDWVGYYPQLIPLTYTYGQALNGEINDHVARAAVPWFFMGTLLISYLLGWRVWGKRSLGLTTAAWWVLIPSNLYWANSGDLEHPMALYFSAAVLFFILAWRSHEARYALISGLMFAGALWTKPTAGSFALGVILLVALTGARWIMPLRMKYRFGLPAESDGRRYFWQKFRVAAITGLACLPIGGMWYARNLYLGHPAITFPDEYWHDLAQRSGQELGWLVLILLLAVGLITWQNWPASTPELSRKLGQTYLGLGLFLLGVLPNALVLDKAWTFRSAWEWVNGARPQDRALSLPEIALILAGLALMAPALWSAWQKTTPRARSSASLSLGLIAPFLLVWFWNYSYHYRLVLTVTPMIAAMAAALTEAWLIPLMLQNRLRERALYALVVLAFIPTLVVSTWFTAWYSWFDPLPDDEAKYAAGNPALMVGVNKMREIRERTGREQLYVYTLGDSRYHFFFPEMHSIWWQALPTRLDDFYNPTDLIVGGPQSEFIWRVNGLYPNQITAYMDIGFRYSLDYIKYGEGSIMGMPLSPVAFADDGVFQVIFFHYYPPYRRYTLQELNPPFQLGGGQWDFIGLQGFEFRRVMDSTGDSRPMLPVEGGAVRVEPGEAFYLQLYWQRESLPPPGDWLTFIHLVDPQTGEILSQRDGPLMEGLLPLSLMPAPDLVPDRRAWVLPEGLRPGPADILIGWFDPLTFQRAPVAGGGDFLRLSGVIEISEGNENGP